MDDSFTAQVRAPLLYVLGVRQEIKSSGGEHPSRTEVRSNIKRLLGSLEVRGPEEEVYGLAKKALVYWSDEVLINSTWIYGNEWKDDPLEWEVYGTRNRAWQFFVDAGTARGLLNQAAFEVYALCVANGFRGVYRVEHSRAVDLPSAVQAELQEEHESDDLTATNNEVAILELSPAAAAREQLPATLEEWSAAAFAQLRGDDLPVMFACDSVDSPRLAEPLTGFRAWSRWTLALIGAIVVGICLLYYYFSASATSGGQP